MGKKLTRGEWLARNIALPVALVEKPLKFIRNKTATVQEVDGKNVTVLSPIYFAAKMAADLGEGAFVRRVALRVAAGAF